MSLFEEKCLVIDYGSVQIKGILYSRGMGVHKILRYESLPLIGMNVTNNVTISTGIENGKENSSENDSEATPHSFSETAEYEFNLVRFIQSFFPNENNFTVNLSPTDIFVRDLHLPVGDIKKIHEILPFEVENLIPTSLDESEVLGHAWQKDENSSRVIAFTASHEALHTRAAPFLGPDRSLSMLSVEAAGLAAAVRLLPADIYSNGVIAQLDIGGKRSMFNVLLNGELVFSRTIPVASEQITTIYSNRLGLNRDEAETMKKLSPPDLRSEKEANTEGEEEELGVLHPTDNDIVAEEVYAESLPATISLAARKQIREDTELFLNEIVEEVERSVLALRCPEPEIYYLSGGGACIPGIESYLESRLERRVRKYPLSLDEAIEISPWITALGSGEYAKIAKNQRLDFLRTNFGAQLNQRRLNLRTFTAPLLLFVSGLIFLTLSYGMGIIADAREVNSFRQAIIRRANSIPGIRPGSTVGAIMSQAIRICKRRSAGLQGAGGLAVIDIVRAISAASPDPGVARFEFSSLDYNSRSIKLRGIVDRFDKVSLVRRGLSEIPYFASVTEKGSVKRADNRINVRFQIKLKKDSSMNRGTCR